jgi:hypothetical protein
MSLKPKLQAAPPVQFSEMTLRSRREIVTRDAANARLFEHWQSDGPSGFTNRPDYDSQPYMDMLPINSRSSHSTNKGTPSYDTTVSGGLDTNPYFQKYDITQDPRNIARELNASVSEDKGDKGGNQERKQIERYMTTRWLPQDYATENNLTTLKAYESLKPEQNDSSTSYRQYSSWGSKLNK